MLVRLLVLVLGLVLVGILATAIATPAVAQSGQPSITGISDNRNQYSNSQIPRYEKFEITFNVNTTATNLQFPYDAAPPSGVTPRTGVTVDAVFTSPSNKIYTQPAFYYVDHDFQPNINASGRDWIYPNGMAGWRVRFAPNEIGTWQYRLTAQDAGGSTTSGMQTFVVTTSTNHGFVRVSRDPRYFQFEDGMYFPALGYNMNWDAVSWNNPVTDNSSNFQVMGQNGIQLIRMWLSEWSVFGAAWNPWRWVGGSSESEYLVSSTSYGTSGVSMKLMQEDNACMSSGHWLSAPIAVKPNTNYRVRVRAKTLHVSGPRISGQPYGFVAKIPSGGDSWLWGSGNNCSDPGVGQVVTSRLSADSDWTIISGNYNSGNNRFLPAFYLALENVNSGSWAYVDHVWMEEDLGGGRYGPNILIKQGMDHHQYFDQRMSFAFDKVVELAHQQGVYLRPVILEKNDWIFNRIDYNGNFVADSAASNDFFYGNGRTVSRVRWLQQAWWRYLQARWGYSTNIQSWELLNEGDPYNGLHYYLADEFGKYMHQFKPNDHLVSTSNWTSLPRTDFWASANFSHVDFADVHAYVSETNKLSVRVDNSNISIDSNSNIYDTASVTQKMSMLLGAKQSYGTNKPIIRGETGFVTTQGTDYPTAQFSADTSGDWLHDFVWGGINPGGLIESYWYDNPHIVGGSFDHRSQFGNYYRFIKDVPLSNGNYQDVAAIASPSSIRAWGQKDLVNHQAHLWIQNPSHTWKAVVDRSPIAALSGTVTVPSLKPTASYRVQWWNTGTGTPSSTQYVTSDAQGRLALPISNLIADVAVKIQLDAPVVVTNGMSSFIPFIVKP